MGSAIYIQWVFLLSLEIPSQTFPEVCLVGNSKSSLIGKEDEPFQRSSLEGKREAR